MQVDYIIVGFGLAGMSFAHTLKEHGKSFVVVDDASQVSSRVAAGVFNPVILKRFTPVWNADKQLEVLHPFYKSVSKLLGKDYVSFFETLKVFKTVEDQNNWFSACDNPILDHHLEPKVIKEPKNGVIHHKGFGKVKHTGRVMVRMLLDDYKQYLIKENLFFEEAFNYDNVSVQNEEITYGTIKAKKIVFAEGYGLSNNPWFSYLPLMGTKGELITIKAPDLKLNEQIKSTLFVLPMGDDLYWVGATFNWTDKTSLPTMEGREELIEKLKTIIDVPFEVVDQSAGIRPTVKDRRPLVGKHAEYENLVVYNGLGTRGVMIAPTVSQELYEYLELGVPLSKEIDITRFNKK